MADEAHKAWRGSTDGTPWMQRSLLTVVRVLPLWLTYGIMASAIPVYVLLDGRGRKASYSFFRRRIGYGPVRSMLHVFRNMYNMGKVVVDRFAAYSGKRFGMVSKDLDKYYKLANADGAFIMLGSHVGNFEMVGYMLQSPKPTKALVYAGETATIMQNRGKLFSQSNIEMVPVQSDFSHLFVLNAALASGEIVSLPADRMFGSKKSIRLPFMGEEASFPAGPFTLAVQRDVPVIAAYVMKESRKCYRIILDRLEMPQEGTSAQKMEALARAYSQSLERVVRTWPDQWYNFFDFWAQ